MVRIGGFLKTQNRIRRHWARGRFISPYQMGGTIFGKSTMARYPLMHTSSRLLDPHSMIMKHLKQCRKMKGGGDHFWQVHMNALSVDVPICFPGEPQKMVDDHGPTPKRYKKQTPFNGDYANGWICSTCSRQAYSKYHAYQYSDHGLRRGRTSFCAPQFHPNVQPKSATITMMLRMWPWPSAWTG